MNHQDANKLIAGQITEAITKYPNLRFIQILHMLGIVEFDLMDTLDGVFKGSIVDNFYEDSSATLDRTNEYRRFW